MLCVCTKRVCVCNNETVCKAVPLAFSCQTSAISLPFIRIPRIKGTVFELYAAQTEICSWTQAGFDTFTHIYLCILQIHKGFKGIVIIQELPFLHDGSLKLHLQSLLGKHYKLLVTTILLYAESISAWFNQGSVMCLLSILNQ